MLSKVYFNLRTHIEGVTMKEFTMPDSYKTPQAILAIFQIGVLLGTIIWVFAFLQADVKQNQKNIERHDTLIEEQIERQRTTYVRQDVFAQQYQNILEKLERIESKLNDK